MAKHSQTQGSNRGQLRTADMEIDSTCVPMPLENLTPLGNPNCRDSSTSASKWEHIFDAAHRYLRAKVLRDSYYRGGP